MRKERRLLCCILYSMRCLGMENVIIGKRIIGKTYPSFIIAEMSGNHNGNLERALEIVDKAAETGVDAIKLQTYTADTITLDCDSEYFKTQKGSLWEGRTLYDLYSDAYTPWEWHEAIFNRAKERGLICFSTPFDFSAVDFLETLDVPAYKIASYEINDLPLIEKVAMTQKPVIISTGIANYDEIVEAVNTCREVGNNNVILLKCTSAYPSPYEDMNIRTINKMEKDMDCICGLSDHSMGTEVDVAAVALGARVIEKHMTLKRSDGGVDAQFSMEPEEMRLMVEQIRNIEKALGKETYELTLKQQEGRKYGRSLFVSKDIKAGDVLNADNTKSVRPSAGLSPKYYYEVLGKRVTKDVKKGTPISWNLIDRHDDL